MSASIKLGYFGLGPLCLLLLPGCRQLLDETPTGDIPTVPGGPEQLCRIDVACGGNILDNPKTPCTMQVSEADGTPMYDGAAGFELRGRSSLTFPKPQYAVELRQYTELPVWPGSSWSVLDDGTNPGTAWRQPAYDDSDWSSGPAPLGYGQDYLQTEVEASTGPDGLSVTTYFRYAFTVQGRANITDLTVGLMRNDGAAVYLNGVEVQRDNLPQTATYDTLALAPTPDGYLWFTEDVDPALLIDGTNVLAVEVHQAELGSPDMRFDLYLEGKGDDQPADFFEMGTEEDWVLNGQYVDRALFRNRLAFDLFQSFGGAERYAPETRFCEMDLDGEYQGIYTIGEKIERDDDRIDIGEGASPGDTFIVKLDDADGFHANAVGYGTWQMVYPDLDEDSAAAVSSYLTSWEEAVLGPNAANPDTGIFAWLDLDSAVDWVLVNELMKNRDAYFLSVYLWKGEQGKMYFTPWDFDLSMGYPFTDCGATGWVPRDYLDLQGDIVDIPFMQEMAAVPAFQDALVERWAELRGTVLSDEAILDRVEGYDTTLAPAIEANFDRWPIEDIAFSTDFEDNWLCPVGSYDEEHDRTVGFLSARLAWMDENIDTF